LSAFAVPRSELPKRAAPAPSSSDVLLAAPTIPTPSSPPQPDVTSIEPSATDMRFGANELAPSSRAPSDRQRSSNVELAAEA